MDAVAEVTVVETALVGAVEVEAAEVVVVN